MIGRATPPETRVLLATAAALLLGACSAEAPRESGAAAEPEPSAVRILALGDTGYDYPFLDTEDYAAGETVTDYIARARAKWLDDGRPIADFAAPPPHALPDNGGVVAASGLRPVSTAAGRYCARRGCDFGVLLGDNVYPDGLTLDTDGKRDADRLQRLFVEPLAPLAAGNDAFRFYALLGNHDWRTSRGGARAQLEFLERTPPFHMDGFWYRVVPTNGRGLVELFVIDTTLLLGSVEVPEIAVGADGRELPPDGLDENPKGVLPLAPGEADQVRWLEQALADSTAPWRIVLGHHPLWSSGGTKSAQARVLRSLLLPALCRGADAYIAGHDHTLEVHLDDCRQVASGLAPLLHVVSGAGAKQRAVHKPFAAHQLEGHPELTSLWARGLIWGFIHLELTRERARVQVVSTANDGGGVPVEEFAYDYARRPD